MIVTCVYVHVKPDVVDQFIEVTTANHHESVKEPGNLRFDVLPSMDDPCRFLLYEALLSGITLAHAGLGWRMDLRQPWAVFLIFPMG